MPPRSTHRLICAAVPIALVIGLIAGPPPQVARAAVFAVACNVADLVNAVTTANGNGQADTIQLEPPCTYALTSQLTIQPDGGNPLTIEGNGATLSGGDTRRVLRIQAGVVANLNDVTIADGFAGSGIGGGILNSGTLTLSGSSVLSSQAGSSGGGIINSSAVGNVAVLTVNNSTVSGNRASSGGGISNAGGNVVLTINSSVIAENSTTGVGSGGGINAAFHATLRDRYGTEIRR